MDEEQFKINIVRELGEIDAKIDNVNLMIPKLSEKIDRIWKQLNKHSESITSLKVKFFFISAGISLVFSVVFKYIIGG